MFGGPTSFTDGAPHDRAHYLKCFIPDLKNTFKFSTWQLCYTGMSRNHIRVYCSVPRTSFTQIENQLLLKIMTFLEKNKNLFIGCYVTFEKPCGIKKLNSWRQKTILKACTVEPSRPRGKTKRKIILEMTPTTQHGIIVQEQFWKTVLEILGSNRK